MIEARSTKQTGQTLLIVIMLLATALTVVLSLSFKSTTDTQIAKLEEESQKALAASEAAIEKTIGTGVGNYVFSDIGVTFPGINSTASTIEIKNFPESDIGFVTPLLQPNEQYTFYLTDYNPTTHTLGTSYWSDDLRIYFKSSSDTPAIELTFIKSDNTVTKSLLDPTTLILGTGRLNTTTGSSIKGVSFSYRTTNPISISNTKLLIVRSLFKGTRIGFVGSANLPTQGISRIPNTILNTGASKKINFFQSYPQFPSGPSINLFVTSF
jgi:type II secretory pathway pseudopilin PulG